jgi:hypothetical protein
MNTEVIFEYVTIPKMITSDCIAIAFFRPSTGTNPVKVNGLPIEAGQTFYVEQNVGDIDRTQYQVTFQTGTGDNILHVVRTLPKTAF